MTCVCESIVNLNQTRGIKPPVLIESYSDRRMETAPLPNRFLSASAPVLFAENNFRFTAKKYFILIGIVCLLLIDTA